MLNHALDARKSILNLTPELFDSEVHGLLFNHGSELLSKLVAHLHDQLVSVQQRQQLVHCSLKLEQVAGKRLDVTLAGQRVHLQLQQTEALDRGQEPHLVLELLLVAFEGVRLHLGLEHLHFVFEAADLFEDLVDFLEEICPEFAFEVVELVDHDVVGRALLLDLFVD